MTSVPVVDDAIETFCCLGPPLLRIILLGHVLLAIGLVGTRRVEAQPSPRKEGSRATADAASDRSSREWEPRLRRWRAWLRVAARRAEAEESLGSVTDPSAVRAIWKVFASGRGADQRRAVMLLGQIDSRSASRGLTLLAVAGSSAGVRQVAMQTLRRRDPLDFADMLIDRLREPVQYTVHPVGGPGRAGSLTVRGAEHDLQLIFAPPPPPDLLPMAGEEVLTDPQGGPILLRHTDSTGLPFAWFDKWGVIY